MQTSRYANNEHIETEIQLADSGYGQGQILLMSMVEDVIERGGSGYVVGRSNIVLERWFQKE